MSNYDVSSEILKAQREILFLSIFLGGTLKREVDSDAIPLHSTIPEEPAAYSQWIHRVEQRLKQVEMGKNSIGYSRYRSQIPRHLRKAVDPKTPKAADDKISKKVFDETMKSWRRQLHVFSIKESDVTEGSTSPQPQQTSERSVRETAQEPLPPLFIAPDLLPSAYDVLDSIYPRRKILKQSSEIKQSKHDDDGINPTSDEPCTMNSLSQSEDQDDRIRKRSRSISVDKEEESIDLKNISKQARLNEDEDNEFSVDYGKYSDACAITVDDDNDIDEYNEYDYEADGYLDVPDCCNSAFGVYHNVDKYSGIDIYGVRGMANAMMRELIASQSKSKPPSSPLSSQRKEGTVRDLSIGSFICPPLTGSLPSDEKFAKKCMFQKIS
jgi:hypothetical protein